MVKSGSPQLRTTKNGWLKSKSGGYKVYGQFVQLYVQGLWECMSADSWYSGLALRVGIRSKALTAKVVWKFKVLQQKLAKIGVKEVFNKLTLSSGEWHILGCACLKHKWQIPERNRNKLAKIFYKYFLFYFSSSSSLNSL